MSWIWFGLGGEKADDVLGREEEGDEKKSVIVWRGFFSVIIKKKKKKKKTSLLGQSYVVRAERERARVTQLSHSLPGGSESSGLQCRHLRIRECF